MKNMADVNTDTPVVSAIGLTKVFKDFWNRPKAKAVNDIDFEIKKAKSSVCWDLMVPVNQQL